MTLTALLLAAAWIALLFLVAYRVDARATRPRSSALTYTLSLAVYCTSWTYYGSVGAAADNGLGFLPVYLGPTLVALLFPLFLPRLIALSQRHRVSSVPDLLAARYGKSASLAALATLVALLGVVPYIALQLRAVDLSFALLAGVEGGGLLGSFTTLAIAMGMAVFAILFGTRNLQVTEQHHGMVRAIALESLLKLAALLLVAGYVVVEVWPAGRGLGAALDAQAADWLQVSRPGRGYGDWFVLMLLSAGAVVLLPRQFQMLVVENDNPDHARTASWMFPLYLLLINLAVLPLALAGLSMFGDQDSADIWVLALPLALDAPWLAQLAFLGGLSAATGMIIVETTALATMVSNDWALPLFLRARRGAAVPVRLGQRLLVIRRWSMVLILLAGYAYAEAVSAQRSLVSIGLVSFAAVAQFLPAVVLGLLWTQVRKRAVAVGLAAGCLIWLHSLFLPSVWPQYEDYWPAILAPTQLLGVDAFSPLSHGVFWSLGMNLLLTVLFSLWGRPRATEIAQAEDFVHAMRGTPATAMPSLWRGGVAMADLESLLRHVLGAERTAELLAQTGPQVQADSELLQAVESELAAAVGSASARILVGSVANAHEMSQDEVFALLAETSGALRMARELQHKSDALERATRDLRAANLRLRELDRLKDDFVSTVTHELRTPLTSIRAFTEIMRDDAELSEAERSRFLKIVIDESDRLTRLIEQVLDLSKLESESTADNAGVLDVHAAVERAVGVLRSLADQQAVAVELVLDATQVQVRGDPDRLHQVLVNLIANALKFCPADGGRVQIRSRNEGDEIVIMVSDNGPGIAAEEQELIFDRFRQARRQERRASGTGLGLAITKRIVEHWGGRIWVHSNPGWGAQFSFSLPVQEASHE
nr:histidine kinase [Oceanococcus sp. HetDA_MAG_MS8]